MPHTHAVAQPLELLADHRVLGFAISDGERDAARDVRRDYGNEPDPVEHPAQFLERDGGADGAHGKGDIGGEDEERGEVQQRHEPVPLEPAQAFGKGHREVEKHRGGEQTRANVGVIHHLVETRQLAGVVRTEKDEREQAKHIEVQGLVRAAAAEIDKEADQQVGAADAILIQHQSIEGNLPYDHCHRKLGTAAAQQVAGEVPGADAGQMHRDFDGMLDGDILDALEDVADVDAGVRPGTAGSDIQRFDARGAIDPDYAIVGKAETELRLKIYEGGHTCSQCDDRQDGCGQLELEFLKHEGRRARQYATAEEVHVWRREKTAFLQPE